MADYSDPTLKKYTRPEALGIILNCQHAIKRDAERFDRAISEQRWADARKLTIELAYQAGNAKTTLNSLVGE